MSACISLYRGRIYSLPNSELTTSLSKRVGRSTHQLWQLSISNLRFCCGTLQRNRILHQWAFLEDKRCVLFQVMFVIFRYVWLLSVHFHFIQPQTFSNLYFVKIWKLVCTVHDFGLISQYSPGLKHDLTVTSLSVLLQLLTNAKKWRLILTGKGIS